MTITLTESQAQALRVVLSYNATVAKAVVDQMSHNRANGLGAWVPTLPQGMDRTQLTHVLGLLHSALSDGLPKKWK